MPKTYRYKNLSFAVADDEDVNFTVEFVSDGNNGYTVVNIPGDNDPEIKNEGTVSLGKGKTLRDYITVSFSAIENPVPVEDQIIINYKINGQIIQQHKNDKSEEERPMIVLLIKFPKK